MNMSQIVLMFFKLNVVFFCPSDSRTKMPPRLHFSQPQQSFLAIHFDTFISKTKYLHSKRAFALKHFTLQDKDEMVALKH